VTLRFVLSEAAAPTMLAAFFVLIGISAFSLFSLDREAAFLAFYRVACNEDFNLG
jgi:hypothetical protein